MNGPVVAGVILAGGRAHPVFALWPVALRDDLAGHLTSGGSLQVRDYAAKNGVVDVVFGVLDFDCSSIDPFFNVNTPDDLTIAQKLVAKRPS